MPTKKTAEFDASFIGEIAQIMADTGLTEVELTKGEDTLRLSKQAAMVAAPMPVAAPAAPAAPPAAPAGEPTPSAASSGDNMAEHPGTVTSPMVGTVYLASSPEAAAFVSVGDQVKEGDTLMIIEAMKVMNPLPAPHGGTVKAVLVADAQPVEFGDPLIVIE
jgi:acetyl-CoA carboxylase biotin carboxyl carrier protein